MIFGYHIQLTLKTKSRWPQISLCWLWMQLLQHWALELAAAWRSSQNIRQWHLTPAPRLPRVTHQHRHHPPLVFIISHQVHFNQHAVPTMPDTLKRSSSQVHSLSVCVIICMDFCLNAAAAALGPRTDCSWMPLIIILQSYSNSLMWNWWCWPIGVVLFRYICTCIWSDRVDWWSSRLQHYSYKYISQHVSIFAAISHYVAVV